MVTPCAVAFVKLRPRPFLFSLLGLPTPPLSQMLQSIHPLPSYELGVQYFVEFISLQVLLPLRSIPLAEKRLGIPVETVFTKILVPNSADC